MKVYTPEKDQSQSKKHALTPSTKERESHQLKVERLLMKDLIKVPYCRQVRNIRDKLLNHLLSLKDIDGRRSLRGVLILIYSR